MSLDLKDCRGSVLLLVVWVFAIMGIVAAFLLYRSELEWAAVVNLERNSQAGRLAEEVLQERLALLRRDDTENDSPSDVWFGENGFFQDERDGYRITVKIEDESSKPNINILSRNELGILGLDDEQADLLLDWIDVNDEISSEGAETEYYQSLTPAYKPRDGFLSTLREMLSVKNGKEIHSKIAPYGTVFGKYNINILTESDLENLLISSGFDKIWVERMVSDVKNYRTNKVFKEYDELRQLSAVSLEKFEELRPLLTLTGSMNLNFTDEKGLETVLNRTGYNRELAGNIIRRRREQPFAEIGEAQHFFRTGEKQLPVEQYFTTISTIIRYQIWLTKGKHTYYLETVQERVPADGANKWRTRPLFWCVLRNREAPELPEPPPELVGDGENIETVVEDGEDIDG